MQKSKNIIILKNTLIIFVLIVIYCVINRFDFSTLGLYVLFIGDFSIGICPRLLIGSILSLFKDSFTVEWVTSFLKIFTFVIFFITAHYFGSSMSGIKKEDKTTTIIFIALFIACPFSITIYGGDIFGFIDVFCMAVLLITAYFVNNKVLMWTFPLLFCAGIFIHDAYITAYMSPCLGILAYYVITKYKKKLWASVCFVTSALSCFATIIYRVFFSSDTIKMTEEEVVQYLMKKGNCSMDEVSGYIEAFLFNKDVHGYTEVGYAENIWELLKYLILLAINQFKTNELLQIISIIPLVAVTFIIWIKAIKNSNGFMEKVPYILFMLTLVPQIASLFISVDVSRFISTIVITQFLYLFMCIRQKDEKVAVGIKLLNDRPQYFIIPCLSVLLMNII